MADNKPVALAVKCCLDCPFFAGVPLISALAEAFGKDGPEGSLAKAGSCNLDEDNGRIVRVRLGVVGPEREAMLKEAQKIRKVRDRTTIPDDCPLRTRDVVVTLGS